jgi:nitrate/TMAO reductase-like tetraheme cytochrome c subunit/mono/diheme cytochrome c family protein
MLTRLRARLKRFFFPPSEAPIRVRILPYAVLGFLSFFVLVGGVYAWDYTNSPEFCGTACHTMPPEYNAYLTSPHARVDCVECHIGRGFIATRITRKAGDVKHIIATTFKTYEFPIRADDLRPARETCERCHFPEKFSDDTLREIRRFSTDESNTPISIYLTLKTGGGSKREGLGRGIHWHIENEVYYLPLDPEEQEIPYVRVVDDDGSMKEYVDVTSGFDPASVNPDDLKLIDCISCHNRITHLIYTPEDTVDLLMSRDQISADIPEIRRLAVEAYNLSYGSIEAAMQGIAGIENYYQEYYPAYLAENADLIQQAIAALQEAYTDSVFPEQKADWTSHPTNVGHKDSPGCFRCHDGTHMNTEQEAIRLECNLCHSIPVVAGPSDFVTEIEISRGPEPQSHLNPNWITLHREVFDDSCSNCHTTGNPGGLDNSSFCSNSACHGSAWEYAGFDAPSLRELLKDQLTAIAPVEAPSVPAKADETPTYTEIIGGLLGDRCGACHGEGALAGLNLTTYSTLMAGGQDGAVIVPGNAEGSLLVQVQREASPHFAQLTPQELSLVERWINTGAPE